eukprot:11951661-Alexandrium_andersonii.AAC.1
MLRHVGVEGGTASEHEQAQASAGQTADPTQEPRTLPMRGLPNIQPETAEDMEHLDAESRWAR